MFRVCAHVQLHLLGQGEQGHEALQHQHRVQISRHLFEQVDFSVAEAAVATHEGFQPAFLLLIGQLAKQHQPHDMEEGYGDEIIDVDAAVAEQADVALYI